MAEADAGGRPDGAPPASPTANRLRRTHPPSWGGRGRGLFPIPGMGCRRLPSDRLRRHPAGRVPPWSKQLPGSLDGPWPRLVPGSRGRDAAGRRRCRRMAVGAAGRRADRRPLAATLGATGMVRPHSRKLRLGPGNPLAAGLFGGRTGRRPARRVSGCRRADRHLRGDPLPRYLHCGRAGGVHGRPRTSGAPAAPHPRQRHPRGTRRNPGLVADRPRLFHGRRRDPGLAGTVPARRQARGHPGAAGRPA